LAAPEGNKFALGNNGGRPPVFATPQELMEKVIAYFDHCEKLKIKSTVTGIALYLGFDSRQSFYDYEQKEEFSYITKRAKLAVENGYELAGQSIDIFALKNMGWKDKTEVDQNTNLIVNWPEEFTE
jgi:hypothetical protein